MNIFKKPTWQQGFWPKMLYLRAGKFKKTQTKNSEEPAQSTEQTRTESVQRFIGRGPIDYLTIKNPTYQVVTFKQQV